MMPQMPHPPWAMAPQAPMPPMPPVFHVGRIKSYNPDKGFGFIDCWQTFQRYRRDVFLHKMTIGDLVVGDIVTFTVEFGEEGLPQAANVHFISNPDLVDGAGYELEYDEENVVDYGKGWGKNAGKKKSKRPDGKGKLDNKKEKVPRNKKKGEVKSQDLLETENKTTETPEAPKVSEDATEVPELIAGVTDATDAT